MTTINEPAFPTPPVICNFFFEQIGPPEIVTYDGDTYPYAPLPSDKGSDYRYAMGTTPISTIPNYYGVNFFAEAYTYEGRVQSHVIPPPGVRIMEYFWDFGDGFTGYGPSVTHHYAVADPNTAVSLTVVDSLGREFSTTKQLSLVSVAFGYVGGYTIRGNNTEVAPKKQEAVTSDKSLSVDGVVKLIWVKHGGRLVRYQNDISLSADRAVAKTHFRRHTTDTSRSTDVTARKRHLPRHTTDTSLTSPASAKRNTHRYAKTTDQSKSVDKAKFVYFRPLSAALAFRIMRVFPSMRAGLSAAAELFPKKTK